MEEIRITDKISYIAASEAPLSADIGIIRTGGKTWLYDVGNGEKPISGLNGRFHVVLSHFHLDHAGNLSRMEADALYLSKWTCDHLPREAVSGNIHFVKESTTIGSLRIFPLPSSHAKGCLGMEIDETYAFVGDTLYSRTKNGRCFYNTQLLQDEIKVLKALRCPYLLVSHFPGLIRRREEAIAELEAIYARKTPNGSEIPWIPK